VSSNLLMKLAYSGLEKNKKAVLPYMLVSGITIMIFYLLRCLIYSRYIINDGVPAFYGADYIVLFLNIGSVVVSIVSLIFVFYGNQFVMKSRKKEIGLYGILGLSRKNMATVLFTESVVQAVVSLGIGIISGAFLNKLMVLLLYKIIHQPYVRGLEFSVRATVETLVFFAIIYTLCLIVNLLGISLRNPITLLRSENMGEKEPKVKVLSLISGVVCLVIGYYIALSTNNTFDAINRLLVAVLFVIAGTYDLFIAGSIFILKMLRKNPRYYYKTKHFISVSNLIFRMKHNAAGLATICILSTGVIFLLVCSSSLMMLGEQNINSMFKSDVMIHMYADQMSEAESLDAIGDVIEKNDINADNIVYRQFEETLCGWEKGNIIEANFGLADFGKMRDLYILTLDNYNHYTGKNVTLKENEILRYSSNETVHDGDTISVFGIEFAEKDEITKDSLEYIFESSMGLFSKEVIVVADRDVNKMLLDQISGETPDYDIVYMGFDSKEKITTEKWQEIKGSITDVFGNIEVEYKEEERAVFYSIYGGAFFVGIFLAGLFLMETVMMIYYKQMSEGLEDRKRFKILSNTGLTEKEAKGTIKNQVLIMFFLPVGTAIVHMIFASKILRLFLRMLVIVDTFTFVASVAIVCLVFLAVYILVYSVTSRHYYNIVYTGR